MNLKGLEKRLYQLIISRLDGDKVSSQGYQQKIFDLVDKGIGGFILFGGKREEIRAFIERLQSLSEIPLFIASDIERGVGQQIKGSTVFPCQMAVRAAIWEESPEDVAILRDAVRAIAVEAIDVGINVPLIPVLDVNQNPDNPIICTRAFSDEPEDVSWFGLEYIGILEGSGLLSCAKHFPGHGDTAIDSHISLPGIDRPLQELMDTDILPFREAVQAGVSTIMVGHLHIPALDSIPASLSRKVITGLLREGLGFHGLVLTDALNMSALSGMDNLAARCIHAGVDLLLHPSDVELTVRELTLAIQSKVLDEGEIDAAIGRILKVKSRLHQIRRQIRRVEVDYDSHDTLSRQITEMSITLVKHKGGILPITENSQVSVVVAGEEKFYRPYLYSRIPVGTEFNSVPENGGKGGSTSSDDITIIAIFSETAAWRGRSGIDEQERERIRSLIRKAKASIVISFGSPYVLRHFSEADILIAAYDAREETQEAVIRCLKGELDFKGQLPVNIPLPC
ncbi:MAG: hypothetical protein HZB32_04640 [Nitrospirae bacterium]|nr:hypothetical protein [Nitrospirota bacterium]